MTEIAAPSGAPMSTTTADRRFWFSLMAAMMLALALTGCQSVPPPPPVQLESPDAGRALIYFFRPAIDQLRRADRPALVIDGQPIVLMAASSYAVVHLAPGARRLQLVPGPEDAATWQTETMLDASPDTTHFVAIWNQNQPIRSEYLLPVPIKGSVLMVPMGFTSRTAAPVARFEVVEAQMGEEALRGLQRIPVPARLP